MNNKKISIRTITDSKLLCEGVLRATFTTEKRASNDVDLEKAHTRDEI